MLKTEVDGEKRVHVSLQAFVDPEIKDAKCLGFISNFYGNPKYSETCATAPYGNYLFLNGTQDVECDASKNPQVWWLLPASSGALGEFELQSANKPGECARTLAVENCNYQPVLIQDQNPTTKTQRKTWKLTRRYAATFPSPPPPPVPVPAPQNPVYPQEIAGPVIAAPSSTSSGYVTVTVKSPGGGSGCSVTSLVFTSSSPAIGSSVDTVTSGAGETSVSVPTLISGYNMIYATGVCSDGSTTERSNGLTVFYQVDAPVATPEQLVQANLYGSNYGIQLGSIPSRTFTKLPIVNGSYNAFSTAYISKVTMSGVAAARLIIASRRRRNLLTPPPPVEICSDITASTPVFEEFVGNSVLSGPRDISLSGSALAAVEYNGTFMYFADTTSTSFTSDTSYDFVGVALSGSAILATENGYTIQYASNAASPSWQQVSTTGMDWSCGGNIALSGTMAAAIDTNGHLWYTTDITNPSWTEVIRPACRTFNDLSLTGKQIACTDTSTSDSIDNVWYAPDITAITNSSDWANIEGALRSIAISTP